jgi:hypothetical protein
VAWRLVSRCVHYCFGESSCCCIVREKGRVDGCCFLCLNHFICCVNALHLVVVHKERYYLVVLFRFKFEVVLVIIITIVVTFVTVKKDRGFTH